MGFGDRSTSAKSRLDGIYFIGISLATILTPLNFVAQAQPVPNNTPTQLASEQSIIYVDPQTGNDTKGDGSQQSPFKTITQALKIAQFNTTIDLASGTYSEATGETFPLIIEKPVTIKGSAGGKGHNIVIRGNGYFISPTGAGQNVAIVATDSVAGIIGVTVTNPHSRGHGLWIESASPIVASNTFSGNGNTGVSANGNSSPLIEDNLFYNNAGNGLLVYGTSTPQVNNNTFEKTGFGVSAVQNSAFILKNNNFTDNRIGIILEGDSQATLRNNQIENSLETGLVAIARSRADLGTVAEPGNNSFRNNKLDIQNASSNWIVAVGTDTSSNISGNIDFNGDRVTPIDTANNLPSSDRPIERLPAEPLPTPRVASTTNTQPEAVTNAERLPSPPPLAEVETEEKEYVFNAPAAVSQPVPFPPQSSSNSQAIVINASSAASVIYKVLVEATNDSQQTTVRSLYPEAFATIYQGKSMLQVGAFNNKSKAETTSRSLQNLGLNTYILD